MQEIIDDLNKRKLKVAALVCQTEDGKLQVVSYGHDNLVKYISEEVNRISINERLEGRMIRPIIDLELEEVIKENKEEG